MEQKLHIDTWSRFKSFSRGGTLLRNSEARLHHYEWGLSLNTPSSDICARSSICFNFPEDRSAFTLWFTDCKSFPCISPEVSCGIIEISFCILTMQLNAYGRWWGPNELSYRHTTGRLRRREGEEVLMFTTEQNPGSVWVAN